MCNDSRGRSPGGVLLKDIPHGGSPGRVDDILLVLVHGKAKGAGTANSLALQGAFPHTAPHLLGQFGGVVFGKGFHQALYNDTAGTFNVGFCSIEQLHAVVAELLFIDDAVIPGAGNAVCFPADHIVEHPFPGIGNHLLELRAVVRLAGDMPVNVFVQNDHAVDTGVGLAVPALTLNGLLRLMTAAAVAVVGNKPLAAGWIFLWHTIPPFKR